MIPLSAAGCGFFAIPSAAPQQLAGATAPPASSKAAAFELGRYLFYDRRLSGNGTQSCGSCHRQELGFSDGQPTPVGASGERLPRNSQGLFNNGELATLTWANPSITSLEQQLTQPLFGEHPREMGARGYEAEVLARLRADPTYPRRFAVAFPTDHDPIQWPQIIEALAAFTGALVALNSPYDRFIYQGDTQALSPAAQRGMHLFFSAGPACGHCHVDLTPPGQAAPPRWADLAYLANGAGLSADLGLAEQTSLAADAYRFRVPPLRNVAVTAPYMHDGSLPTLEAVLRFYEAGGASSDQARLPAECPMSSCLPDAKQPAHGRQAVPDVGDKTERAAARHPLIAGFSLSDADRHDLLAFLEALTDTAALHDPRYCDPFRP